MIQKPFTQRIKDGIKVEDGFTYNSGTNDEWMTVSELQDWLNKNKDNLGKI